MIIDYYIDARSMSFDKNHFYLIPNVIPHVGQQKKSIKHCNSNEMLFNFFVVVPNENLFNV